MQEKTIYALGFFDGVHLGHQALLNTCKALAEEYGCAAGVQTFGNHPDALVEGKAPGLINSIADREALLRELDRQFPGVKKKIFGAIQRYPLYGWSREERQR